MALPGFAPGMRAARSSANTRGDEQAPPTHAGALEFLFDWLQAHVSDAQLIAVGHRVVHGGTKYAAPMRLDAAALDTLAELVPLAPLHQPHNLLPIRVIAERRPGLPQVACFDTAFHQSASPLAQAFALPPSITDRGVRRYGFHGLSYEYIASVLPQHDARAAAGKTVVLHLGNGASMCAMSGGKSVATTMGFTAVDGLPMGTRSGTLDPGVVLYLMQELKMDARRNRDPSLPGVGPPWGVRRLQRHACAPREPGPAGEVRHRSVRVSHRARARLARRRARRARCDRVYRRHRRARGGGARSGVPAGCLARRRPRHPGEHCGRSAHQHRVESGRGVGDSHERGIDDRAAHARARRQLK